MEVSQRVVMIVVVGIFFCFSLVAMSRVGLIIAVVGGA